MLALLLPPCVSVLRCDRVRCIPRTWLTQTTKYVVCVVTVLRSSRFAHSSHCRRGGLSCGGSLGRLFTCLPSWQEVKLTTGRTVLLVEVPRASPSQTPADLGATAARLASWGADALVVVRVSAFPPLCPAPDLLNQG